MRKFLLSFALLVAGAMTIGAVTVPETGVYTIEGGIENEHRGFLTAGDGYSDYPVLSGIQWSNYKNNSATPIENGTHWYVKADGEKFYIYNLGLEKFIAPGNGTEINFSDKPYAWQVVVNSVDNNYNSIRDAGLTTYLCFACGKGPGARPVHFNNQADDGGSMHKFTTVADGTTTYAKSIEYVDELLTLKEISYTLTDEAGNVFSGSYTGFQGVLPTFTGAAG